MAGLEAAGKPTERTAGGKLGQLPVVADQHQLALRLRGGSEQPGKLAGAEHVGLLDDEDRAAGESPEPRPPRSSSASSRAMGIGRIPAASVGAIAGAGGDGGREPGVPVACQASWAAASVWLLPVPASPTTTSIAAPERVRARDEII